MNISKTKIDDLNAVIKIEIEGKDYESKEEADKDVQDPTTNTQEEHIEQNVQVKVQQLPDFKGDVKYD